MAVLQKPIVKPKQQMQIVGMDSHLLDYTEGMLQKSKLSNHSQK